MTLAAKLYQQSPYCARSFLPDDPLQIKFAYVKKCTSFDSSSFNDLVAYAHKWVYAAPLKSKSYNDACLSEISLTGYK